MDKYCLVKDRHPEVFVHSPIADAQGCSSCQSFPPRASRQSAPVIRLFRFPSRYIFTPPSAHDFGCTEMHRNRKTDPLPSLAHCCPRQHKWRTRPRQARVSQHSLVDADALDYAGVLRVINHFVLQVLALCKLDFTHFKRHKRGNLQYDGTEWRGVSVHRSWRSIVKNPPTPTTSGYAQR